MHSPPRFAAIVPMGFIPDLSRIETMGDGGQSRFETTR